MLHHHTNDPAQRAADIADREAEKIWQETHNFQRFLETWQKIYEAALRELQLEPVSL